MCFYIVVNNAIINVILINMSIEDVCLFIYNYISVFIQVYLKMKSFLWLEIVFILDSHI